MTTPLGQTFYIDEPVGGVSSIILTKIELFFKAKNSTHGIEIHIRSVENGYPSEKIIPFSSVYVPSSNVNVSEDASLSTEFIFSDPVSLSARKSYFLAISPAGGAPDYYIWTAEPGSTDITDGVIITQNNPTGQLFLSSDSRTFAPLLNEDLKVIFHRANFTQTSGTLAFTQSPNEYIKLSNTTGTFVPGEKVFIANTTTTTTGNVRANTLITFASHSFANNDMVYINSGNSAWVRVVQSTNSTSITLNANNLYANTTALVGLIRGGSTSNNDQGANTLFGLLGYANSTFMSLYNSTASTTSNFSNNNGRILVGALSTAYAYANNSVAAKYNAIVPRAQFLLPSDTTYSLYHKGMSNTAAADTTNTSIFINKRNELVDYERILRSKSEDLNAGVDSLVISAAISTSNTKVSPIVYDAAALLQGNKIVKKQDLRGVTLVINNTGATTTPTMNVGDSVSQASSNATGTIVFANTSYLRISNVVGKFTTNQLVTDVSTSNTANVSLVRNYGEDISIHYSPSRYFTKNVVLADGQDAEDVVVYLTAYKPQNSDVVVYGKFENGLDPQTFDEKIWTELPRVTADSIISNRTNFNDYVELEYGLPTSTSLTSRANCASTSTTVNLPVQLYTDLKRDSFIYIKDNNSTQFTVNQVSNVSSTAATLTLYTNAAFTSSNVTIGRIDGMTDLRGAFKYDGGNNVIRYVSNTGAVYDSYKTFAIKLVPVSSDSATVPHIADMRAIAIQV